MSKKIPILFSILIMTAALFGSYFFMKGYSVHKITSVYQAEYQENYLYGIDMTQEHYYIFCVNTKTGEQNYILYPIEKNGDTVYLSELSVGKDGKFYIHHAQRNEQDILTKESIDYCDFSSGTLKPVWDIKKLVEEEQNMGQQYWFFLSGEEKELFLFTAAPDSSAVRYHLLEDGTFAEEKKISIHQSTYMIEIDRNLTFWSLSLNGDIYHIGDNGVVNTVFMNNGSQIGTHNVNWTFEENEVHFLNLDTGKNYKVSAQMGNNTVEVCGEHENLAAETFDASLLYNVVENDGVYVGILPLEDGRQVPAMYGETELVLDSIHWSAGKTALMTVLLFLVVFTLGVGYVWVIYGLWLKKGGAPVWGISAMLLLPLTVLLFFVSVYFINHHFLEERNEKRIQQMEEISQIAKATIPLERFNLYRQKDEIGTEDMKALIWSDFKKKDYWQEGGVYQNQANWADVLFFYKNNEIYSANLFHPWNIPASYFLDANVYEAMKEAAEENKVTSLTYNDLEGRYLSIFTPVLNQEGEVIGVMQVYEQILDIMADDAKTAENMTGMFFTFVLVLFICVQFILWWNTRSLKILKKTMMAVSEGDFSARTNLKGRNEIALIGKRFDSMAASIQTQVIEMDKLRKTYAAFTQAGLFPVLKKRGIEDIALGDQKAFFAFVMTIDKTHHQKEEKNTYLSEQISMIQTYGGVVHRMYEGGVETIFPNRTQKNAVDLGIALLKKIKTEKRPFCIGIAKEHLRMGIIGTPKRMILAVTGEQGGLSAFLQRQADIFDAGILITGESAGEILDFQTAYHSRVLGYVYFSMMKRLEIVYEVLDCENQEDMRRKWETKEVFEEGVRLFMAKEWNQARKCFIHVLEKNQKDTAARNYVLLCEKRMDTRKEEAPVCVAVY